MEIDGRRPTSEIGECFDLPFGPWYALATYARTVAPEITSACKVWLLNYEGDGLDAAASVQLAERLQAEIDAGRAMLYHNQLKACMSDRQCPSCKGTGMCKDPAASNATDIPEVKCGFCGGRGYVSDCCFSVELVQDFVHFLRACGGFKIY